MRTGFSLVLHAGGMRTILSLVLHAGGMRTILSGESFSFGVIVSQLKSAIQQAVKIDFFANRLAGRGGLAFFNKVAPAEFIRSQSHCFRYFVEMPLQRKDALWRAKSTERPVRRHVGRDRFAVDAHV